VPFITPWVYFSALIPRIPEELERVAYY